jgi:DNA methylase
VERRAPVEGQGFGQRVSQVCSLAWPGRTYVPRLLPPARHAVRAFELNGPGNRVVLGDALHVARALAREGLGGKVDLVYVDPPFASQAKYVHEARLDGPADGRVVRAHAYDDRQDLGAYLDAMAPRLEALAALLSPSATLWVHLDWRAAYLVRVLLDEILGRDAFKNEIVWRRAPNLGRQAASHQFGRTLDTLLVYGGPEARLTPPTRLEPIERNAIRRDDEGRPFTTAPRGDYTDASIAALEKQGRVHRTATGKVYVKYFLVENEDGVLCRERRVDALWTDVPPLRHAAVGERTGFPTQKPRALLERIIRCATRQGGLVVDLFAGSGTTASAAQALGRRFVTGDSSETAITAARARLLREGAPFALETCGASWTRLGAPPSVRIDRRAPHGGAPGSLEVTLLSPAEPAAWAVDAGHVAGATFRATWHSERAPGARARPVARSASLEGAQDAQSIAVRVYADDGTLHEGTFAARRAGPRPVEVRP